MQNNNRNSGSLRYDRDRASVTGARNTIDR